MKRIAYIMMLLVMVGLTVSCSKKDSEAVDDTFLEDSYFQYVVEGNITSYDVDEEGKLHYISLKEGEEFLYLDSEGKEQKASNLELSLTICNIDGSIETTMTIPDYTNICLSKGRIYGTTSKGQNEIVISEFHMDTNTMDEFIPLANYSSLLKMDATEERLYFIGIHKDFIGKTVSLASEDDRYSYQGERIGYVDLETGNLEEIPIDYPLAISTNLDQDLVIYAYDEKMGYYFTIYDGEMNQLSEPMYHNMGPLKNFEVYNSKNEFVYMDILELPLTIRAASLRKKDGIKEMIPNTMISPNYIQCKGAYTYYVDSSFTTITRIKNEVYIRNSNPIQLLSEQYQTRYSPFGCGYTILEHTASNEEMALYILSQDENYDIYSINTMQDISVNIRDNGTFYPLNDVPGVNEYLDSCFPYIKDAASNTNGDIWMLPVLINIPAYIYNEAVCNKAGIEFSNTMDVATFANSLATVKASSEFKESYFNREGVVVRNFLYQYLRNHQNFNDPLFQEIATISKDKLNNMNRVSGDSRVMINLQNKNDTNFLYMLLDMNESQMRSIHNRDVRACQIPSISENEKNIATCFFLAVNPASKNLEDTLLYISSLSKYLASINTQILSKDRTIYPDTPVMDDLYAIYGNGDIQFSYPDEIMLEDFEKFMRDEMDIQQVISESNRRMDIFLNE